MIYVDLPDTLQRPLPFYLAMEELLAAMPDAPDHLFFMWQVDPTVICGRNQDVELEVNLPYCRANAIDVVRRKSGGGCVYADRSNIMFSYITHSADVVTTFTRYTSTVAAMLRSMGLDASATDRNDILIGRRKVSGNAFYHLPGRSIVHGTMLYDTDPVHMANAITPSRAKLQSKGVTSVSSRITTVREHSSMTLEEFKGHARRHLCGNRSITLTPAQVLETERMEQAYRRPGWLEGTRTPRRRCERIEGVGEIATYMTMLPDGSIDRVNLTGDFFLLSDLDSSLLGRLHGVRPERPELDRALQGIDVAKVIAGLSTPRFVELMANR